MHSKKTLPHLQNQYNSTGVIRLHLCTALDLNMGYYTIRLDPAASKMCTIILPWGKYSYKRLPMGFGGSADILQA
jgi:hypothetical protein